ncbi:MAG: hypothetical protein LAO24_20570 [Acidobacteriia bacterium]|nr:hypothetical protein [Terriglobia bacterium]
MDPQVALLPQSGFDPHSAFTNDDLRVVETISLPMGVAIEGAAQPKAAGIGAGAG